MRIRWIAVAGGLALAATPALTACSAATSHQVGARSVPARESTSGFTAANGWASSTTGESAVTASSASAQPGSSASSQPGSSGSAQTGSSQSGPSQPASGVSGPAVVSPAASSGVTDADLAQIDQQLSDRKSVV